MQITRQFDNTAIQHDFKKSDWPDMTKLSKWVNSRFGKIKSALFPIGHWSECVID
jgi:hypothetical protein